MKVLDYVEKSYKDEFKVVRFGFGKSAIKFKVKRKIGFLDAAELTNSVASGVFISEAEEDGDLKSKIYPSDKKVEYTPITQKVWADIGILEHYTDIDTDDFLLDDFWHISNSKLMRFIRRKIDKEQIKNIEIAAGKKIRQIVLTNANIGLDIIEKTFAEFDSINLGEVQSILETASKFKSTESLVDSLVDSKTI